jgi:hypothetical protein
MSSLNTREQGIVRVLDWTQVKYSTFESIREYEICTYPDQRRTEVNDKSTKLIFIGYDESKSTKLIFIGYDERLNAYKL